MDTHLDKSNAKPTRWPSAVIALHWITALLVLTAFAAVLGRELLEEKSARQLLLNLHRYAGMTALLLLVLRIPIRLLAESPDHGLPKVTRLAASAAHGLLYLCLMAAPFLGYALMVSRFGKVDYLGISLPALLERDRDLAESIESIHGYIGWAMLALIGLHAVVALWHHHVRKDQVLAAMLPHLKRRSTRPL